jgi:hypothetical protein
MIPAHPLTWPDMLPRSTRREGGAFKTSLAGALCPASTKETAT